MHAVVNKLTLGKPIDEALVKKIETDFYPRIRQEPGFVELRLVRVSDGEAVILGFFTSQTALEDLSSRIAGPWFAEHGDRWRAPDGSLSRWSPVGRSSRTPAVTEPRSAPAHQTVHRPEAPRLYPCVT